MSCCLVAKLCPTLFWSHGLYSLPGLSVHGISQAEILEFVSISFSRVSFWPRDRTHVFSIDRGILYPWATRESGNNVLYLLKILKTIPFALNVFNPLLCDLAPACPSSVTIRYALWIFPIWATPSSCPQNIRFIFSIVFSLQWPLPTLHLVKSYSSFMSHLWSASFLKVTLTPVF